MSIIWHKLQQWLRRYTTNVCNEKQQQQQQQQQQLLTFISFSNVSKKIKRLTNFVWNKKKKKKKTYSNGIIGGTEPLLNLKLILCTSPGWQFGHKDSCTVASKTNLGKKALERHLG